MPADAETMLGRESSRAAILRAMAKATRKSNALPLGFEATLWATADKLRGHMDAAEDKHGVLEQAAFFPRIELPNSW
jgi:hypothetical protein